MNKVVLIIFGLVQVVSVSAKESIRGQYEVVGDVPAAHSIKKPHKSHFYHSLKTKKYALIFEF